mmetsp:Transcript_50160/g.68541  ORF Transcript_50160/g.68541 Transcript_50160/m.68541 type:complete len:159 (+) Transcript_50160:413-889(+)
MQFTGIKGELDHRTEDQKGESLHNGYETLCGNKGSKLSGGQKQRIAIARAVIRKPQILLLDEATSALDEASQRKVQNALDKIMVGRTSLVIAHRLTTVEKCSRVAVIENGQIVESGTFDNLKNQEGGYFANLAQGMKKTEKELELKAKSLSEKADQQE